MATIIFEGEGHERAESLVNQLLEVIERQEQEQPLPLADVIAAISALVCGVIREIPADLRPLAIEGHRQQLDMMLEQWCLIDGDKVN